VGILGRLTPTISDDGDAGDPSDPVPWQLMIVPDRGTTVSGPTPPVGNSSEMPGSGSASWTLPPASTPEGLPGSTGGLPPTSAPDSVPAASPADAWSRLPGPLPEWVLLEIAGKHDTRKSAQDLPTDGPTEVEGQWEPGDVLDLYRVLMRPGSQVLKVGFHVPPSQGVMPDHLVLYDGQGHILGDQPLSVSPSGLSVLLSAPGKNRGAQAIYVGVYSSQNWETAAAGTTGDGAYSAGGSGAATSYVLDVSLIDNADGPAAAQTNSTPAGPPSPDSTSATQTPSQAAPASGPSATPTGSNPPAALSTTPASLSLTLSVGVPQQSGMPTPTARPSPWRAVEPLGGALSSPKATRSVDRRAGAFVDFDLLPVPDAGESYPPEEGAVEVAEEAVEPTPSHGGLPVLGASLPAVKTGGRAEAPAADGPPEVSSAAVLDEVAAQAREDEASVAVGSECSSVAERPPTGRPRSLALLKTGVGLAYVLAFTYLLPDLTAAFQASGGRKRKKVRWGRLRRWLRGR
jgi:hypothetical protein